MGACTQQSNFCSYQNTDVFSKKTFQYLENLMYSKKVEKDHHLFVDNDPADRLYYLKQGQIKITKMNEEGKELVLYIFQAGDLIGELGISTESRYSYSAKATRTCEVGIIQQKDLETIIWQHGEFAVEFMRWMSNMHAITRSKFRDLMLYGKKGALCSTLIRLANSYGIMTPEGIVLSQHFTNTDLAELIGTSRETVNRMLSQFKKDGAVIISDGTIIITSLEYLKTACSCENCSIEICRI
ncbi:Crp/Fnr family transcriptional regulator [Fictibacillus phosphorivorans]|uniref:Crp/Fnr family transcriptional regulator n=1 Tax=Fictibacillus phosphorivorans TaxID=1221500 RepID=UPI001293502A|nr:Crp/Fnr family transcriptional regulator [Fictibacillus phosphorivorans]MQR95326.1 Crp/Fnr family transcriptional regulator [Fictibacillus phosphorivorans]